MSKEEYFKSWLKLINLEDLDKVVREIKILYSKSKCFPDYHNIFKVFNVTHLENLKVVMLGQDPYNSGDVATGIAFGNETNVKEFSPSLKILKEAAINFEIPHNFINFDPTLEEWSKQGILLLNSALTVEEGKPLSHKWLWRDFISKLLKNISLYDPGLVYILWGNEANTFKKYITSYGHLYSMPHPAYYARTNSKIPSSFFQDVKKKVKFLYGTEIKWYGESTE